MSKTKELISLFDIKKEKLPDLFREFDEAMKMPEQRGKKCKGKNLQKKK